MLRKTIMKKIVGICLIILGLLAIVTPFTPGSWLIFIGLEFLGFRILLWERVKEWFKRRNKIDPK